MSDRPITIIGEVELPLARGSPTPYLNFEGGIDMLGWALTFFIVALIAAFLGFGGVATAAAGIAKILFFVFLVALVVAFLFGRRPSAAT